MFNGIKVLQFAIPAWKIVPNVWNTFKSYKSLHLIVSYYTLVCSKYPLSGQFHCHPWFIDLGLSLSCKGNQIQWYMPSYNFRSNCSPGHCSERFGELPKEKTSSGERERLVVFLETKAPGNYQRQIIFSIKSFYRTAYWVRCAKLNNQANHFT